MTSQAEIASLFYRIPFQSHTRLELLDELSVRAPDIIELKNHFGTMHGGMLYALGEVAAAVAMAKLLAADSASLYAITRRGEIEYLKPARGPITASGQVSLTRAEIFAGLEHSRSLEVPVSATLKDVDHQTVATLSLRWYVSPRRAPASAR